MFEVFEFLLMRSQYGFPKHFLIAVDNIWRYHTKPKMRKPILKFILSWTLLHTALAGMFGGLVLAWVMVGMKDLPEIDHLTQYTPKGKNVLMDFEGEPAFEFFQERRIVLKDDEIPELTKQAFLAAEDWRFYTHFGVDLKGLARAIVANLKSRRLSQGASTITQQLSRNLFLSHRRTLERKLKEMYLTFRIERRFTKDEILTLYLNQIYLGEGTYGVGQAAKVYFGKKPEDLALHEHALLAGLPQNPNRMSPFRNPKNSLRRRNLVLKMMEGRGIITESQRITASSQTLPQTKFDKKGKQNHFTYAIFEKMHAQLPSPLIEKGQLHIHTAYDPQLQNQMEKAIAKGAQSYARRHGLKDDAKKKPQFAALSLDIHSGEIRAMVGSRDFSKSLYNRAVLSQRQPGSSIKPFLYALAMDQGYTQSSFLLDAPISFDHPRFGTWTPENYDRKFDGYMSLRSALARSKNTPAVRLLQDLGVGAFISWLGRFGLGNQVEPNLTIALGSQSVKLIDLALAYAMLGNGGHKVAPQWLKSIVDKRGSLLYQHKTPPDANAMSPITSYLITDALRGVIQNGSGRLASTIPCQLAGKTGTTNNFIDSIFAGYSSELVTVVWVGFDDNQSLGRGESGSRTAGPIWRDIMELHCAKDQPGPFLAPADISMISVDQATGLLPNPLSQNIKPWAFKKGSEPIQDCCVPSGISPKQ